MNYFLINKKQLFNWRNNSYQWDIADKNFTELKNTVNKYESREIPVKIDLNSKVPKFGKSTQMDQIKDREY